MMTLQSENLHEDEMAGERRVLPLEFEEIGFPAVTREVDALMEVSAVSADAPEKDLISELEARLQFQAKQHSRDMEEERRRAREEAVRELQKDMEERIARERQAVIDTCDRFARERTRYFAAVEEEVVRLSLAIAARVLHRETEIDPLLLRGAVRVALEKVQESETASLRVPEEQVEAWKVLLLDAHRADVRVLGDSRLSNGECLLETSVGRVDLGVKAQLEEIERGFFDLLQQRPA